MNPFLSHLEEELNPVGFLSADVNVTLNSNLLTCCKECKIKYFLVFSSVGLGSVSSTSCIFWGGLFLFFSYFSRMNKSSHSFITLSLNHAG